MKSIEEYAKELSDAIRACEKLAHEYACMLELGPDRQRAFEVFENIRTATRVR